MLAVLALLAIPTVVTVAAKFISKNEITWKEFAILQGVVVLLVLIGYGGALHSRTADTELWNSTIAAKVSGTQGCCHSYPCNCHESCSGSGKNRSCSTVCSTCYEHSHDERYTAVTTTQEEVFAAGCISPGSGPPDRWKIIMVGEPASTEHTYTNYIKGSPDTILRRRGLAQKYRLPAYPEVFDYYRANHLIQAGVTLPDAYLFNDRLGRLAGDLGSIRQVNLLVVVTNSPDREWAEGLREAWLGGKKNDAILVVGAPNFPEIAWADVVSWTENADFKVNLKDDVEAMKTWDSDRILRTIHEATSLHYKRRSMKDFEYLWATIEPSSTAMWWIAVLSLLLSVGGSWFFWKYDPFDEGSIRGRYRNMYRSYGGSAGAGR